MFGEDMSFFEKRMEVLVEQIRDALNANACQSERIADAMEKLTECITEDGRLKTVGKAEEDSL